MKKMKLKSIIAMLLVALVSSGISVAAVKLTAKDIGFISTHEGWEATNVNEAMNDLYNIGKYEITPDTYFYDSTTSGEEIVRYKKVDGKYYLCDKNGDVTTEEEQDVTGITLLEYTAATSANLSLGKAGFANSEFILGNGIDSQKTGLTVKELKSISGGTSNKSGTIDITTLVDNWKSLTTDNFYYKVSKVTASPWSGSDSAPTMSLSNVVTLTYNSDTGILNYTVKGTTGISGNANTAISISAIIYCIF